MICQKCFYRVPKFDDEVFNLRFLIWGIQLSGYFWGELSDDEVLFRLSTFKVVSNVLLVPPKKKIPPSCRPSMSQVVEEYVSDGSLSRGDSLGKVAKEMAETSIYTTPPEKILTDFEPPKSWRGWMVQMMDFSGFQKGMIFQNSSRSFSGGENVPNSLGTNGL